MVESAVSEVHTLEVDGAIERAVAYGIDLSRLEAMLRRTPTERLEMLRALGRQDQSAVERAVAYGIDVSLLELALTWTPTQRLQQLEKLVDMVRVLHTAGAKQHGTRSYSQATDE